jgi:regulator of protease activity HflC (stomatin/prohibitin superfamily)
LHGQRRDAVSTRTWETPQGEAITMESRVVEVNFVEQYTVSHLRYDKWRDGELVKTECSASR